MKIYVINGPNLNLLGQREPALYGQKSYESLCRLIEKKASELALDIEVFQSNHEGDLVDFIQRAGSKAQGIILNAAAYSHTSIAILDALKAVNLPTVEVHLTDLSKREDFRKHSYVALYAEKRIMGKGFDGYLEAMDYLAQKR